MIPIIIKEGIIILMAGAMFVLGSVNIANLPSQNNTKIQHTAVKQIKQIDQDYKKYQKEYIDGYMKDVGQNSLTKNELINLKESSLDSYTDETNFKFITDKTIQEMRKIFPKECNPKRKETVIYEYLRHKFILNRR